MAQLDYIVCSLENLGGKVTYSQIYDEYEKLTGKSLTAGIKAGIRKNI